MKNESLLKRLRDLGFIFILLLILACVLWECHKWGLDLRSEFSSVLNLVLIDFAFLESLAHSFIGIPPIYLFQKSIVSSYAE